MIQILQVLIPLIIGTVLYTSTLLSKRKWLIAIGIVTLISCPFFYSLINGQAYPIINAINNLELYILFVWAFSGLLVTIALIRIYIKIKVQKH